MLSGDNDDDDNGIICGSLLVTGYIRHTSCLLVGLVIMSVSLGDIGNVMIILVQWLW